MTTKEYAKKGRKAAPKEDRVPQRVRKAAEEHGWEVHTVSRFWTRLKKDGVSIEMKYTTHRETEGRAYVRDVILTRVFYNQREIIEYMAES